MGDYWRLAFFKLATVHSVAPAYTTTPHLLRLRLAEPGQAGQGLDARNQTPVVLSFDAMA